MRETSAYEVYLNIKLVRIFSSGAYLGEFEIEKSTITLKYATDAERIDTETKKFSNSKPCWHLIYNKDSSTKNELKPDCSSLSTC